MANRLQDVKSLEEFKLRVLTGIEPNSNVGNIKFHEGLEEFVDFIIQNGTEKQRFAVGWEKPNDSGFPLAESKALVYTQSDNELLLFLLSTLDYLDRTKVQKLYGQLKRASQQDLQELGMAAYGCHGFPSSSCTRDWEIVIDNRGSVYRHPIYLQNTSRKVGLLFAAEEFYREVMQTRFPERVVSERISV